MFTTSLAEAAQLDPRDIGHKAWHLGRLAQAGFPVPEGFVVSRQALHLFCQHNQMAARKNPIDAIANGTFPPILHTAIGKALAAYPPDTVWAVRSSGSQEDLPTASFAGQYESFLGLTGETAVKSSILACWASLYSDTARHYAAQRDVQGEVNAMAVVVQRLVDADTAGVSFSMNPVTGDRTQVVINASWGLGEAVVSGEVTPDTFVVSRNGHVLMTELGDKTMKMVRCPGGTRLDSTSLYEQTHLCLTDEQICEVAKVTVAIEQYCGYAVDIEFAWSQNRLYLLQSRPVVSPR